VRVDGGFHAFDVAAQTRERAQACAGHAPLLWNDCRHRS
jgi:hypothetical protein